jgi:hypothetical protein
LPSGSIATFCVAPSGRRISPSLEPCGNRSEIASPGRKRAPDRPESPARPRCSIAFATKLTNDRWNGQFESSGSNVTIHQVHVAAVERQHHRALGLSAITWNRLSWLHRRHLRHRKLVEACRAEQRMLVADDAADTRLGACRTP